MEDIMARKICFINQKGGVGKTTTTMQTAAYLYTKKGKRVLMIDMDPQGNLTTCVGVNTDGENTISELLLGEAKFEETIMKTPYGDIIPSDSALGYREMEISGKFGRELLLFQALKDKLGDYDYVLIDCPPAINTFTYNVFMVADSVVVVSEVGLFSARGCGKMIDTVRQAVGVYDRNIHIAGILFTKNNQTKLAKEIREQVSLVSNEYGVKVFETMIGTYPAPIGESQALCKSLFDYAPKHKATAQYAAAIEEMIEAVEEEK
ncbi:MAG: ParA family protein [Ruminococcaceae bacterium]|nr:ParA family protein [Oscillospiraceae bacterium]